jgi:hypothetical protein
VVLDLMAYGYVFSYVNKEKQQKTISFWIDTEYFSFSVLSEDKRALKSSLHLCMTLLPDCFKLSGLSSGKI